MTPIRAFAAARRRALAAVVAASGLAAGLAVTAPAAHAGVVVCDWTPIALMNGWHSEQGAYGTGDPAACVKSDGMVYLSGSVAATSPGSSPEFGSLPTGSWPRHELYFDVYTMGGSYGVLRIDTHGLMYASGGLGGSTQFTSLAGVSYPDPRVPQTDLTLQNGWQSADSLDATGDPAYSVTSGVVHLSGSLHRPAGTPPDSSPAWAAAVLPAEAKPSDGCLAPNTYAYGGGISPLVIDGGSGYVYGADAQYTSLAGISYPQAVAPATAWLPLPMLTGQTAIAQCSGLSFFPNGRDNVVYLNGYMKFPAGFNGEVAILPSAFWPAHDLYMLARNQGAGPTAADAYVVLRITAKGRIWISSPPNGSTDLVSVSGLSFHLGS
jgi:hypothetical protein